MAYIKFHILMLLGGAFREASLILMDLNILKSMDLDFYQKSTQI